MRSIIAYFIKNPIAGDLLMVGILILGIFGMLNMKSTSFPEVESRLIVVQVVYPGSSPEEIEQGIVSKIEENLKGLTGLEQVTSVSSENTGQVNVEVAKGYDTDLVIQDVRNAVDRISAFPAGMEPPTIFKSKNLGQAISFALMSDQVDLKTLKQFSRQVENDLLAMDGISQVELSGFPEEEIEIAFRESDLRAYQLTFEQATRAIRTANLQVTGGSIKGNKEELLIRANNKKYYADELRDIVVKTSTDGNVVYLHQVADLKDQWSDNPNRSYVNSDQAVVISVKNTIEEDVISISRMVNEYIADFNEKNEVVKSIMVKDNTVYLIDRINLLTKNGLSGFFIVLILLAMFLNWRLAFWVAIAIPISFAGMFIISSAIGVTINVISLFGMILVIGILVDDGIVIAENIYQTYESGVPRIQAAIDGTMNVLPAVLAAILTTVTAFCSFFFLDGRIGEFFSEMAIVVIFSLIFSLVEGALILPAHIAHSKALSANRKRNPVSEKLDKFMFWMRDNLYAPVLNFAMYNKALAIAILLSGLFITSGAFSGGLIKGTFFPNIERDDTSIVLKLPAGTREATTEKWLNHIEASAWEANELLKEQFFAGEKEAILKIEKKLGPSSHEGRLNITLLDGDNRDSLTARHVSNKIRELTGPIYEAESATFGASNVFGKPISISFVGKNIPELNAAVEEVKNQISQLVELKDVTDNNQEGLREINITLKDKALFLGLNLNEVISQVRQGFFGSEVQRLQRGADEVRVWVRYGQADRSDISQLQDMRVRFANGREYPLNEIANLEIKRGVIAINHIDGQREVKIEADIAADNVSVSDITSNIKTEIIPSVLVNFPSVQALYEGQNKEQEKTSKSIRTVMPIIALMMFFIIAVTFGSLSQTLVVFALIPFGLIGAAWGHWAMDAPVSLFSVLGIIALIGVLVNDALVLVATYNQNLKAGLPQMDAIYKASISRFRPIVLTSLTTIAGLAPLLGEKSMQAQFLIPVAISIAFGLALITVIILILLPVLLILTNHIKMYTWYVWEGKKPAPELVESAVEGHKRSFILYLIGAGISIFVFVIIIRLLYQLAGFLS